MTETSTTSKTTPATSTPKALPWAALAAKADAEFHHAKYPQYQGHWDRPEWVAVEVTHRCARHGRVSFEPRDVSLGHPSELPGSKPGEKFFTVYSVRTHIDTIIDARKVRVL